MNKSKKSDWPKEASQTFSYQISTLSCRIRFESSDRHKCSV